MDLEKIIGKVLDFEEYSKPVVAALLLIGLFHLPDGYFRFLGITLKICALLWAFVSYVDHRKIFLVIYALIAFFFNPSLFVMFDRTLWVSSFVILAIFLAVVWYKEVF